MRLLAFNNLIVLKLPIPLHVGLSAAHTHSYVCNPYALVYVQTLQGDLHATCDWLVIPNTANEIIGNLIYLKSLFFITTS